MSKKINERATCKIDTETEMGIIIPNDAFETIVLIASLGTDGVYSVGGLTKNKINSASESTSSAVKVEVIDKEIKVSLAIVISYGYNVPDVSNNLIERIKTNVENMTEFTVSKVNIKVVGIYTDNR